MKMIATAAAMMLAAAAPAFAEGATHHVAIQVNSGDEQTMNVALNNAVNLTRFYEAQGDDVVIEIVAYGPGLAMMIPDRSPVEDRINAMSLEYGNMSFSACGNTHRNWSNREGVDIPLLDAVSITPSGVVRLVELQQDGYAYIRP
ncbi:DsrE family protein [Roseibacterium sp. SDUM158017]|uniref:DsrE family protein n=1 Tax=Roseicyclus salinarum TaxID=3036773 RepID=UPI002414DE2E|nr:DsrE family protein [Roseibacterium sp. SDUM158017]MDG4650598.1 DsrE family protein [Roseibacterium sp. SDUM158017]